MSIINGYDLTNKYSIDKFPAQKGNNILFNVNIDKKLVKYIKWNLGDGYKSNKFSVKHIFVKDNLPAEGYVTIKCKIINIYNEIFRIKKKILIVPKVTGFINYNTNFNINNHTKKIKIDAQQLFNELVLGNTFGGDPHCACGGACLDSCPQYEILSTPIKGLYVKSYGLHKLTSQPSIRSIEGQNETCNYLYKNNYLGLHSKYPKIVKTIEVYPNPLNIKIKAYKLNNLNKEYNNYVRNLSINGISQYMIPNYMKIEWNINKIHGNDNQIIVNYNSKNLLFNFQNAGKYKVIIKIFISKCPVVIKTQYININ